MNVEKKGTAIFLFFPAAVLGKLYKLESYYHMLYEKRDWHSDTYYMDD